MLRERLGQHLQWFVLHYCGSIGFVNTDGGNLVDDLITPLFADQGVRWGSGESNRNMTRDRNCFPNIFSNKENVTKLFGKAIVDECPVFPVKGGAITVSHTKDAYFCVRSNDEIMSQAAVEDFCQSYIKKGCRREE